MKPCKRYGLPFCVLFFCAVSAGSLNCVTKQTALAGVSLPEGTSQSERFEQFKRDLEQHNPEEVLKQFSDYGMFEDAYLKEAALLTAAKAPELALQKMFNFRLQPKSRDAVFLKIVRDNPKKPLVIYTVGLHLSRGNKGSLFVPEGADLEIANYLASHPAGGLMSRLSHFYGLSKNERLDLARRVIQRDGLPPNDGWDFIPKRFLLMDLMRTPGDFSLMICAMPFRIPKLTTNL